MSPPSRPLNCPVGLFASLLVALVWMLIGTSLVAQEGAFVPATPAVEVQTIQGESVAGRLSALGADRISIVSESGKSLTWQPTEVARISFTNSSRTGPPTVVTLHGGSEISASIVTLRDETMTIRCSGQPPLESSIGSVRSIRFRAPSNATDAAWLGYVEEPQRKDRLVIRRDGDTLDPIEGTVISIDRDAVVFDLGGNTVEAPLGKLEGVIFSNAGERRQTRSIQVTDVLGSKWMTDQVRWDATADQVTLSLDGANQGDPVTHSLSIDQLIDIRFSGGILYLADAEVARQSSPAAAVAIVGDELAATWFSPQSESQSIVMPFSSQRVIRIPDHYQNLVAGVRLDPEVKQFTPVTVSVAIDGEVVWTQTLNDRKTIGLVLPIGEGRQLTLLTRSETETEPNEFTSLGNTLGHRVQWLGARLLK